MSQASVTLPHSNYQRVVMGFLLVVGFAAPLLAQPQSRPSWMQGMPSGETSSLAPHPQPPAPTPGKELPLDKVKLPPGFKIEVWADMIANARTMTLGRKGTLFVGSRGAGNVYAVIDQGDKREVVVIAQGLEQPNGVVFRNGSLYVAEISRITRYDDIENRLHNPPEPVVVYGLLPKDRPHGWKFLDFGPDGKLYFNIGAPCNICMPPETHAVIARINPDGSGFEYVARGVRNSVGFDFHPVTHELYFTNHGRDWLGDDIPNDTLHHAPGAGFHFGYPYCHQGDILDPEFGKGHSCTAFAPPLLKLGPHVAPNGIRFYTGDMFPPDYRNRIIIAQRGSWNRTEKIGYRLMQVDLKPGRPPAYEVFAEGWLQGDTFWGRPCYVHVMPDGALLVSDDYNGAIYRISYQR